MIDNKLYQSVDFIYKLILLNFTYFFAIIIGVGIVGFFPATYALFRSITLVKEKTAPELLQFFSKDYKNIFIKANIMGYFGFLIFLGSYINYQLLLTSHVFIYNVLSVILLLLVVYLTITMINYLILLSNNEAQNHFKYVLTQSASYTFVNIGYTLLELILLSLYVFILIQFPVFFLFGGTSLVIYLLAKVFHAGITKIHKQEEINYLI